MDEKNVKWLWRSFLEFSITNRTFFFFFTAQLLLAVSISSLFLLPQQPSLHEHSPRWDRLVLCALFNMLFFLFFPLLSAEQGPLFTDGTSPTAALKIFSSLGRMLMKASAAGCYFRDTCVRCD